MASEGSCRSGALLEGTFDINGNRCKVTLTSEALKWATAYRTNEEEFIIPIAEVLSTTVSTEESEHTDVSVLQLVYIEHKENHVLGRATVHMAGKMDICTIWSKSIQECLNAVPERPKRALVVINPASGDKLGPEMYKEKIEPVFLEASVKTDVILSESADHAKEIIRDYDLTSIDSIVTVGGDGIYQIVADSLLRRQMKEAGLDLNNPDTEIPETCLPIGIIPCGSRNALAAFQLYGTLEVESVALSIVRGGRQTLAVQGVWSGGELLTYSFIFFGIGAGADWIYDTQNMRDMGKQRYQLVTDQYGLKESYRHFDVTIETRPVVPAESSVETAKDDKLPEETSPIRQQWTTSYQGQTPMINAFISDFVGLNESKDVVNLNFTRLYVMKKWSGSLFLKHVKQIGRYDPAALHTEGIQHIPCVEYKVTLNNADEKDRCAYMLNIDGEMYFSKGPSVHVKLFPAKMNLFASVPPEFIINNSPRIVSPSEPSA